ncbi:unnamed protein product [Brassicogethes aeneus]|uniref:Uncharacterized protein n=1 Tax=Brassicogethes aeneus TaxID=1431903 RepID=A0A9P0FF06_BRAAE|nr:unnamed protein product [Brassicogethes aeneus]
MNSALKPVLTASGPQNSQIPTQLNKPMHPQGVPTTYGQPTSHMPQNLVNLPHNTNVAHSHPNAVQNHYSLNVPNSQQHYMGSNIPASNHPVAGGQMYNVPKTTPFSGGYQPNLGHPPNVFQQNAMPPVSQSLPPTAQVQQAPVPPQPVAAAQPEPEKPQSNGTSEENFPVKPENHVSLVKDKPPTNVLQPASSEKLAEKVQPTQPAAAAAGQPAAQEPAAKVPAESSAPNPASAADGPSETDSAAAKTASPEKTAQVPAVEAAAADKDDGEEEGSGDSNFSDSSDKDSRPAAGIAEPVTADSEVEKSQEQPPPKQSSPAKPAATTAKTPPRKAKATKADVAASPKTPKADAKSPGKLTATGKLKRQRTRTQPYQSPLPELEIISKISSHTPRTKTQDEKLVVFYKNEFLAVRNSEGTFFVCQAVQNIYKSSSKIKIRWLSQAEDDKTGEIYTPDFYDLTDFDCILTNLNLTRVNKGKYRLPKAEKERTDSILNRSLAVEKGEEVHEESFTEEHPDGLDISLYTEESQLNKKKGKKRKASPSKSEKKPVAVIKKSPEESKVRKVVKKKAKKRTAPDATPKSSTPTATSKPSTSGDASRSNRAKRRSDNVKTSPVVDQKKAKVLAKVARKTAVPASAPAPAKSKAVAKSTKNSKPSVTSTKATKTSAPAKPAVATRKTKRLAKK